MLPSDFSRKPLAAGLLVALYGTATLAQDAGVQGEETASVEQLEEVVVTARRTEENMQTVLYELMVFEGLRRTN